MPTDNPDFPDTFITDNIWHSSSPGVKVRSSTGANFPLATQRSDVRLDSLNSLVQIVDSYK